MNKNSPIFTFSFATVMVLIVATLLSLSAIGLKSFQENNVRVEKMQNILQSIDIASEPQQAESIFNQYVKEQIVITSTGDILDDNGISAFDIDLKKEQDKVKTGNGDKQHYPLFSFSKEGNVYYVIPVLGKGLWGPIWGYIALEQDMNTIYGVSFGHKSETPGLGGEISTTTFQEQFVGKKIFDGKQFTSVKVIKGGADINDMHGVDAISGGTVTSNGVTEMLARTLRNYILYFEHKRLEASE